MKTEILLPDGVADAWFHVTAGGETYESNVCRGRDLRAVIGELMFGSAEAEEEGLDDIMAGVADPDFWSEKNGQYCACSIACGEDPDIEVHRITDEGIVSLLNAANYVRRSLFS